MGEIGILNVGAGDTKLVFDPTKPEDVKRSARIVTDMIRRGFVILVELDAFDAKGKKIPGAFRRVHEFDENTCEYIIADDQPEKADGRSEKTETGLNKRGDRRGMRRRLPASKTRALAVGRTAGG